MPVRVVDPPQKGIREVINMIVCGESVGKGSLEKRKAYSCHVFSVSTSRLPQHQPITFTPKDGHDDPVVIIANIDRFIIKRILVDSRSSCNVLTWEAIVAL